ncbi:MAG: class I SAM-dependent methyltransferase [Candidatus Odinarchaeia archaeon]
MPHKFPFNNVEVLEANERKKWQPIEPFKEELTKRIPPNNRKTVIEIGAGAGYFTIPLSKIFDVVYAVDINQNMLNYLKNKTESMKIKNIKFILSNTPPQITEKIDLILFALVLHEFDDPVNYLNWAVGKSKRIIIIDWKKEPHPDGPPIEERISEKEAVNMVKEMGLKPTPADIYQYHYVLFCEKSNK